MSVSVATNNQIRAREVEQVETVLPDFFKDSAENIMTLIKEYYNFLNQSGGPSESIRNLVVNHNVDSASSTYLDAIELEIAKSIPQARSLDRRRLFKIIKAYYNSRGSDESVYAFFKIFYNEIATLVFPKEFLIHSSDDQSLPSDIFRIQDSYKWQEYSYVIKTEQSSSEWKPEFLKFVHPAGLKLFVALTVLCVSNNDWHEDLITPTNPFGPDTTYLPDGVTPDTVEEYWNYINWAVEFGKHSPRMQPNVTVVLGYLFVVLMGDEGLHYLTHVRSIFHGQNTIHDDDRLSAIFEFISLIIVMTNRVDQLELHYDEYQVGGKFRDGAPFIDGYGDYTLSQTYDSDANVIDYDPNEADYLFKGFGSRLIQDSFTRSMTEEEAAGDVWDDGSPSSGQASEVVEAPSYSEYPLIDWENSRIYLQGPDDEFEFTNP